MLAKELLAELNQPKSIHGSPEDDAVGETNPLWSVPSTPPPQEQQLMFLPPPPEPMSEDVSAAVTPPRRIGHGRVPWRGAPRRNRQGSSVTLVVQELVLPRNLQASSAVIEL